MSKTLLNASVRILLVVVAGLAFTVRAEIKLPGSQPQEHDYRFLPVSNCTKCHARTTNGVADPYFSWHGGMMAQAARDPVFRAALAIANQDIPGSGEYCIRCHSPRGWLEGRSSVTDASLLKDDDLEGVSCQFCHRLVDPLSAEAKLYATNLPPGYGNGMYVMDTNRVLRGPYAAAKTIQMHFMAESKYHASSELCGNCHNVSNPLQANDAATQKPESYGHIERTYSEWKLSEFAVKDGTNAVSYEKSCQGCHFPLVPQGGQAVKYTSKHGDLHRTHFATHNAVGGSTWVQDAVLEIWGDYEVDKEALAQGKENAQKLLKTAASLNLELRNGGKVAVTITNLTGHKLPTGYPEGRRMWVNVRFMQGGKVLDEIGRYGEKEDELVVPEVSMSDVRMKELMPSVPKLQAGRISVKAPTLIDSERTRVYESKPGISATQASKYKLGEGPSFHFVLNDVIAKDNRIPPRGFRKSAAAEHLSSAVGAEYADGQYWDRVEFAVPAGTEKVEVRLMYQSVSWEYLKFLVENNRTDGWGRRLYEAWTQTGRCEPTVIAEAEVKSIQ